MLPHSYQYQNLSDGADRVGGQLHEDKKCPFSGVTKSGRVWRKMPESGVRSVTYTTTTTTVAYYHAHPPLLSKSRRKRKIRRQELEEVDSFVHLSQKQINETESTMSTLPVLLRYLPDDKNFDV